MTRHQWLSGTDTKKRWLELRDQIDAETGEGPWADAFGFLKRRLETRYLEPIRVMQVHLEQQGEGFAIVTLQCALIEFLAALVKGCHYVAGKNDPTWDDHAYKDSSALFVRFLRNEEPFKAWFNTNAEGEDFYQNVRCGLLHEAMTKKDWRINTSGNQGFDISGRVVYRDTLQQAIDAWLDAYEGRLATDKALREGFIRKMNHVAQ